MNRKNKYRGQRTDTKEWVYGNLLKLETDYFTDSNDTGFMWYIIPLKTNGSWSREKLMLKFISPCFEVIPETVGQYTGLKDKNGKEIYGGDILEFTWEEDSCWGNEGTYKGYVQHDDGGYEVVYINRQEYTPTKDGGMHPNSKSDELQSFIRWTNKLNIEIIGNIHDNPELIRRKNNGISK